MERVREEVNEVYPMRETVTRFLVSLGAPEWVFSYPPRVTGARDPVRVRDDDGVAHWVRPVGWETHV